MVVTMPSKGTATARFDTKRLPTSPDALAPDGMDVRLLLGLRRGGMAHFQLAAGQTTRAVKHRKVEEIWLFLGGRGRMWRKQGRREKVVAVKPGVCVTLPVGTVFQLRAEADEPLSAIGVTMPPWPGPPTVPQ